MSMSPYCTKRTSKVEPEKATGRSGVCKCARKAFLSVGSDRKVCRTQSLNLLMRGTPVTPAKPHPISRAWGRVCRSQPSHYKYEPIVRASSPLSSSLRASASTFRLRIVCTPPHGEQHTRQTEDEIENQPSIAVMAPMATIQIAAGRLKDLPRSPKVPPRRALLPPKHPALP